MRIFIGNLFLKNKVYTCITLFALFGFPYIFLDSTQQIWEYLIYLHMITGYAHFVLGFGYQYNSMRREEKGNRRFFLLYLLSFIFSIVFYLFSVNPLTALTAVTLTALYFLFHGILNEKTIFERVSSVSMKSVFYSVPLFLSILYLNSLSHSSIAFDLDFNFIFSETPSRIAEASNYIIFFENGTKIFYLFVSVVLLYLARKAWKESDRISVGVLLAGVIGSGLLLIFFSPLSFIFILSLLLTYHFVTWAIYYLQVFYRDKKRKSRYMRYVVNSVVVHVVFLLLVCAKAGVIAIPSMEWLYDFLFSIPVFLSFTFMHITTSMINESWVKKYFI